MGSDAYIGVNVRNVFPVFARKSKDNHWVLVMRCPDKKKALQQLRSLKTNDRYRKQCVDKALAAGEQSFK